MKDYSFLPKSPTNDNWFDEKSEILISQITFENSGIIPNVITKVEGQIIENSGNSVQILVDNPIHLIIHWESDYSIFAILLLFPIIGIVIFFIRQKKGSNSPKTVPKPEKTVPKTNSNDYENEILLVVFQQRNHPSDFSQNSGYSKKGFFDKFLWFVQ